MTTAALPEARTDAVRKDERFYRPELDCLRFFAFFAVYIFHTVDTNPAYYEARHVPFPALVAGAASAGRFGVDLFFLLSAYLITELLLREWDRYGKLDLRAFYVRRILRIWPLYFLALLIGVLLPLVDPLEYFPVRYALAFAGMVGNWLVLGNVQIQSVMWPLWSVSMEEQFYLLWPAFISRSGRRKTLLYAAAALLMIATASRLLLGGYARGLHSQAPISTFTLTRLDPLALGIASALLLWKRQYRLGSGWRLGSLLTGCGLWLITGSFYSITRNFSAVRLPGHRVGRVVYFLLGAGCSAGASLAPLPGQDFLRLIRISHARNSHSRSPDGGSCAHASRLHRLLVHGPYLDLAAGGCVVPILRVAISAAERALRAGSVSSGLGVACPSFSS